MDEAVRELVSGWLTKARHDLDSARILGFGDSPVLDTAIYHCQQAAEKAMMVLYFMGSCVPDCRKSN